MADIIDQIAFFIEGQILRKGITGKHQVFGGRKNINRRIGGLLAHQRNDKGK